MNLREAKNELLANEKVRKAFQARNLTDLKVDVGLQILELRILKNLTQAKLAKMIGTEQPSIARVERGALLPSLTFLHKIANAVGTELILPRFSVVEENERRYQQYQLTTQMRETNEFKFIKPTTVSDPLKSSMEIGEKTHITHPQLIKV